MGMIREMYLRYAEVNSKQDATRFALRLLGYDSDTIESAVDEEIWRTTEEGKHFKFESTTGEIKAGFGGKLNGKRLGSSFKSQSSSGGAGGSSGGSFGGGGANPPPRPTGGSGGHSGASSSGSGASSNGHSWSQVTPPPTTAPEKGAVIPTTFNEIKGVHATSKEYQRRFDEAVNEANKVFANPNSYPDEMADAVSQLANAASWSDASAKASTVPGGTTNDYGINKIPREWEQRLTQTERQVLAGICEEYGEVDYRDEDRWTQENPQANRVMMALQAKLLGAEVDAKIPVDLLEKHAGIQQRTEVPGQVSMFTGENVPEVPARPKEDPKNPWSKPVESRKGDAEIAAKLLGELTGRAITPEGLAAGKSVDGDSIQSIEQEAFSGVLDVKNWSYRRDRAMKHYLREKFASATGEEYDMNFHDVPREGRLALTTEENFRLGMMLDRAKQRNEDIFESLDYADETERYLGYALLNKAMGGDPSMVDMAKEYKRKKEEREAEERRQAAEEERRREEERKQREAEVQKSKQEALQRRQAELVKGESKYTRQMETQHVERREVKPLDRELSDQEIADRIGGGDMTEGSCASLAFAYIANKFGLDVQDFRGGVSRSIISHAGLDDLVDYPGVKSEQVERARNTTQAGLDLMSRMEDGREYLLMVGQHASIVRRSPNGSGYEYMELQSPNGKNGYTSFGTNPAKTLHDRFGTWKSRKRGNTIWIQNCTMIDVESLRGCKVLETALPYINTSAEQQKKGARGSVK